MRKFITWAAISVVAGATGYAQIAPAPGVERREERREDRRENAAEYGRALPGANIQAPGVNVQVPAPGGGVAVQTPGGNVQIQPPPTSGTTVDPANPDHWRYRHHNGLWWYYQPDNSWVIWRDNQWTPYASNRYRTGYRGYSYDNRDGDGYYYGNRYYRRAPVRRWRHW